MEDKSTDKAWFNGIGLFKHTYDDPDRIPQYEERTVLVKARNLDAAREQILEEFSQYGDGENHVTFLEEYDVNEVFDELGSGVAEVAYRMRLFSGSEAEYVLKYWTDLRPDSCGELGWNHVWHNQDDQSCGCYNCRSEVEGSLQDLESNHEEQTDIGTGSNRKKRLTDRDWYVATNTLITVVVAAIIVAIVKASLGMADHTLGAMLSGAVIGGAVVGAPFLWNMRFVKRNPSP